MRTALGMRSYTELLAAPTSKAPGNARAVHLTSTLEVGCIWITPPSREQCRPHSRWTAQPRNTKVLFAMRVRASRLSFAISPEHPGCHISHVPLLSHQTWLRKPLTADRSGSSRVKHIILIPLFSRLSSARLTHGKAVVVAIGLLSRPISFL